MHPVATGIATGERIPPTDEDNEIFRRNMRRIFGWDAALHPPTPQGHVAGSHLLGTVRRACDDYLHFKPKA